MKQFRNIRNGIKIMAIFAIVVMALPGFVQAATQENTTTLDATSDHASSYNEVTNVANSTGDNPSTWDPSYQGVFIGSSTKESLYQLNDVTGSNSQLQIIWRAKFSTQDIMDGASEWTVRLPVFNDGQITSCELRIFKYNDSTGFVAPWTNGPVTPGTHIGYASVNPSDTILDTTIDMTDYSFADGDQQWTISNRTYVHLVCPIETVYYYVFVLDLRYAADARYSMYLSPNDIAQDGFNQTQLIWAQFDPFAGSYSSATQTLRLDAGYSFDFVQGLGNGIFAMQFNLPAGSSTDLYMRLPLSVNVSAYHSIMVPFHVVGATNTMNFSISVQSSQIIYGGYTALWTAPGKVYKDYVLFQFQTLVALSPWSSGTNLGEIYLKITLTNNLPGSITYYFLTPPSPAGLVWPSVIQSKSIYAIPLASYQISNNSGIYSPNDITTGMSLNPEPMKMERKQSLGSLLIDMFLGPITAGTDLFRAAKDGIVTLITTHNLSAAVAKVVAGSSVAAWLYNNAPAWMRAGLDYVSGIIKNAIDLVWNTLVSIGKFIWSIGEGIFNALKWLADQIVEYGSAVLGLLISGIALIIVFGCVYATVVLGTMGIKLAQGDFGGAKKEGKKLTDAAETVGRHL